MSESLSKYEPVELLAEEFLARYRRGERPSLSEYTRKHPDLAPLIREYFPAMVVMEELGSVGSNAGDTLPRTVMEGGKIPQQLGEYRILREVGRGGMGIVYEAVQESLGRHVALKVLPFHGLLTPTLLERFRREARAVARLHHTNIVPVFGVGEHAGLHYYAMQFIQGQGLHEVLHEVKRLRARRQESLHAERALAANMAESLISGRFGNGTSSGTSATDHEGLACPSFNPEPAATAHGTVAVGSGLNEGRAEPPLSTSHSELTSQPEAQYFRSVAQIGVQVAEALDYAHGEGVLHRDIKPANLLLDTTGRVWVTDFGLAKADETDELTDPGDIVGTLCYMAPERLQGRADARSDVYGLGITLYEFLTLQPAFADSQRARLIQRVTHEDPRRPRKLDPRIPRDLETVVLKAIAKDSSDRYPTAKALAGDLRQFLADRPIRARRTPLLERAWRWCRRNKPLVWTGAVFCLLAFSVLAGSIGWVASDRAAREAAVDAEVKRALDEATDLIPEAQWPQASAAVERAAKLLEAAGRTRYPPRLTELRQDLAFAIVLEDVSSQRENRELSFGQQLDAEYANAFRKFDIDLASLSRAEAAQRIGARSIRQDLGRALDAWSGLRRRAEIKAVPDWQELLEIAKVADSDPWRCQLRDVLLRHDRKALEELAASADVQRLPPRTLDLLGLALAEPSFGLAENAVALLHKAQRQYPGDLWINYSLAFLYSSQRQHDECVRFYTAALAVRPGSSQIAYLLGEALDAKGSPAAAIAEFSKAIELKPDFTVARFRRAATYLQLGQPGKALADYSKVIELDPRSALAWYYRGLVYYQAKQWAEAIGDFSRCIELAPDAVRIQALKDRAFAYSCLGQWGKALADYSELVERGPAEQRWRHRRSIAYSNLGQFDNAIADLTRCIELDAKSAQAWCDRGQAHLNLRQADKAIADYTKAIEVDPKFRQAWHNRASAYMGRSQWREAIADLSRCIELDAKSVNGWSYRGLAYMSLRQWGKAMVDYSKAIELDPKSTEWWTQRGLAHLNLQQWQETIADYSRAIELNPGLAQAWHYRGYACARLGQWEEAIANYSRALELTPKFPGLWIERASAYNALQQWDKANADYLQALALNPESTDWANEMAWFWATCPDAKYRDPKRAVEMAKKAVKLTPNEGGHWNSLGAAHYRAGDWKAAALALNKSMELRRGGDAFDWFFLAMTHWQLGERQLARQWYDKAVPWMDKNLPTNPELRRFRTEAEELLRVKEKKN